MIRPEGCHCVGVIDTSPPMIDHRSDCPALAKPIKRMKICREDGHSHDCTKEPYLCHKDRITEIEDALLEWAEDDGNWTGLNSCDTLRIIVDEIKAKRSAPAPPPQAQEHQCGGCDDSPNVEYPGAKELAARNYERVNRDAPPPQAQENPQCGDQEHIRLGHHNTSSCTAPVKAQEKGYGCVHPAGQRCASCSPTPVKAQEKECSPLMIVLEQAEDDGLWFKATTAPEAYLQAALRRLHAAVEIRLPAPVKAQGAAMNALREALRVERERADLLREQVTVLMGNRTDLQEALADSERRVKELSAVVDALVAYASGEVPTTELTAKWRDLLALARLAAPVERKGEE